MDATVINIFVNPYYLAAVTGLLLYWNASLVFSRSLTAFLATVVAVKIDLLCHLLYSCTHYVVALLCRYRSANNLRGMAHHFQAHSQLYVMADIASLGLLVGTTLRFWTAALVTRLALSALVTRTEMWMTLWEVQSAVEHGLAVLGCLTCLAGCTLQWAFYALQPQQEVERDGFASLLLWYTSITYIVAVGARAVCALATAVLRLWGYRVLQFFAARVDRAAPRELEESGLNPFSEMHGLYMRYVYAVVCAVTAWYYAPASLPLWVQAYVLLRLYLITAASQKVVRYRHVLDRFPTVRADPSKVCAICREDFVAEEPVICLPCGHTFHGSCVREWLVRAATCPTCRQPVTRPASDPASPRRRAFAQPVEGAGFMGDLQPLAPRLPTAAPAAAPAAAPPVPPQPGGNARTRRAWRPRHRATHVASTPAGSPQDAQLPHVAELEELQAQRRILGLRRQLLLAQLHSPAAAPAATTTSAAPVSGEDNVDASLFTDAPLASMSAATEIPTSLAATTGSNEARRHRRVGAVLRRKRRREHVTAGAAASMADEGTDGASNETSQRPRSE